MAKIQRRFVTDKVYRVEGVTERERTLKFFGRMKLGKGKHEYLVFKPVRKASKSN